VVPWERRPGQTQLVAYFEPAGHDAKADAQKIRETLAGELPAFMVPAAFIPVPAFPLTPNGKVDLASLPEPEVLDFEEPEGVPLTTETEFAVAKLWQEVLGIEAVGGSDNFFSLGGHSLLAAQLISRVNAHLGVELTLRAVFEAPTVVAFAALVDRVRSAPDPELATPSLRRVDRDQNRVSLAPREDVPADRAAGVAPR
jgi:acyl carrier protein